MLKQPKKIDLVQGSPEWIDYRKGKIMATDTSVIMGDNPFKDKSTLFEEKMGTHVPFMNDAMQRGARLEPQARRYLEEALHVFLEPCVYEHPFHDWMAASLDGVSECFNYVVEIKCGKKSHELALQGIIPDYYKWQMWHQMEVLNVDTILYVSYQSDDDVEVIPFFREDVMVEQLLVEGRKFYHDHLLTGVHPNVKQEEPEDISLLNDAERRERIRYNYQLYIELDRKEKLINEAKESVKKTLISDAMGKSFFYDSFKCTKYEKKGAVQYGKIKELEGIDLDAYRSEPTTQWRISY